MIRERYKAYRRISKHPLHQCNHVITGNQLLKNGQITGKI